MDFGKPILITLALLAALPACSPKPPEGPINFTPPPLDVGDRVRTTVISSFEGGSFSASSAEGSASGSISMERHRVIEKSVTAGGETGPAQAALLVSEDTVKMTLLSSEGSRMDTIEGPLVGLPLRATRNADTWSVAIADRVAEPEQADELRGIESFENRRWFPGRPVDLGDSWEFDPLYFRSLIESDLGNTAAKGRMTLRSLENHPDGSAQARFDVEITTSGQEEAGAGATRDLTRQATLEARGSLVVDIATMLDRELIIAGTIRSGATDSTSKASLELPLHIEMRREILPPTRP